MINLQDVLNQKLRSIPAVHLVMDHPDMAPIIKSFSQTRVVQVVQDLLQDVRQQIMQASRQPNFSLQSDGTPSLETIIASVKQRLGQLGASRLVAVINATGVILHTNLGRAPLSKEAMEAIQNIALGYSNLELDLATGKRGKRYDHVRNLLRELTGAEDALVVNNNAAAVLLVLSALARGKEVIVSRGQLVEIGGAFRVPDVMEQSGALLVEVGTTNKTRIADYERAITEETGMLLKVHPSNYRLIGFTQSASLEDMVVLGQAKDIPVVEDLGSGVLLEDEQGKFFDEPSVQASVRSGADIVTFSGDKLLGGPQAGIIVGKAELIEIIARHPLTRALRIDKLTIAALEATLRLYLQPEAARKRIPTLAYLHLSPEEVGKRVDGFLGRHKEHLAPLSAANLLPVMSQVGGGSLPGLEIPSFALQLKPYRCSAQTLADRLRETKPPVIGRLQEDSLLFDFRTVSLEQEEDLSYAIITALSREE